MSNMGKSRRTKRQTSTAHTHSLSKRLKPSAQAFPANQCRFCPAPKLFGRQGDLVRHMKKSHPAEYSQHVAKVTKRRIQDTGNKEDTESLEGSIDVSSDDDLFLEGMLSPFSLQFTRQMPLLTRFLLYFQCRRHEYGF